MKVLIIIAAFLAVSTFGHPTKNAESRIIMTFADDGKTPIYENLDDPVPEPENVDANKVYYFLYTRKNRLDKQQLKVNDANGLKKSNFNAANPTRILVHGWQNTHDAESVQIVKDSYLQMGDVNVILFDYENYNSPYLSAVGNAEALGKALAAFVNYLLAHGLAVSHIHLVGHSLGSHICGYAANNINGKLERITGLDPAGPLFTGNKPEKRLSSDDAKIVDVIHTSKSLGLTDAIGTLDFYPHGGARQPACTEVDKGDGCDHASSYRYYSETIKNRKLFPAKKCKNQSDAQISEPSQNPCSSSTTYMGEEAENGSNGIYYVEIH